MLDLRPQPGTPAEGLDTHLSVLVFAIGTMRRFLKGRALISITKCLPPARQRAQPFFHPCELCSYTSSAGSHIACIFMFEENQTQRGLRSESPTAFSDEVHSNAFRLPSGSAFVLVASVNTGRWQHVNCKLQHFYRPNICENHSSMIIKIWCKSNILIWYNQSQPPVLSEHSLWLAKQGFCRIWSQLVNLLFLESTCPHACCKNGLFWMKR